MNGWRAMSATVRVRLLSGDPAAALAAVTAAGMTVYEAVCPEDGVSTEFSIPRRETGRLEALARRKGYTLEWVGSSGLYWTLRQLLRRPVLVLGIALLCCAVIYGQSRVFFVRIEGNETVPDRLILEACGAYGLRFGASRGELRSEKLKNWLLESIPQLQWVGVNTTGCVATVTVRERATTRSVEEPSGVSSIVAACDGVITQCTVLRGSAVCRVGQAVRAGELLVSGYTDCGLSIQATRAEAEIYAETRHELTAVAPSEWTAEGQTVFTETKYAVIIGKNRINFYKGSGISGTSCDKIYTEYTITLPGGFSLPVTVVTEVWSYAETAVTQRDAGELETLLVSFAQRYLTSQLTAGAILDSRYETVTAEGTEILLGNYACSEMIARVRNEEIIQPYGNDNGTDR